MRDVVYVLQHEYWLQDHDESKLLGVFSTQALAQEAQNYFATQVGFRDHIDGFHIDEISLNQRLWSDGFVTYTFPIPASGFTP